MKTNIESSDWSLSMLKFFLVLMTFFFFPFAAVGFYFLAFQSDRIEFYFFGSFFLGVAIYFIKNYSKIRHGLGKAKMDQNNILFIQKGQPNVTIEWKEIQSIKRVPFISPPLYLLKSRKVDKTLYFPSSSSQNFFSFSVGGFEFIYDTSKMGKHIRRMKKIHGIR